MNNTQSIADILDKAIIENTKCKYCNCYKEIKGMTKHGLVIYAEERGLPLNLDSLEIALDVLIPCIRLKALDIIVDLDLLPKYSLESLRDSGEPFYRLVNAVNIQNLIDTRRLDYDLVIEIRNTYWNFSLGIGDNKTTFINLIKAIIVYIFRNSKNIYYTGFLDNFNVNEYAELCIENYHRPSVEFIKIKANDYMRTLLKTLYIKGYEFEDDYAVYDTIF